MQHYHVSCNYYLSKITTKTCSTALCNVQCTEGWTNQPAGTYATNAKELTTESIGHKDVGRHAGWLWHYWEQISRCRRCRFTRPTEDVNILSSCSYRQKQTYRVEIFQEYSTTNYCNKSECKVSVYIITLSNSNQYFCYKNDFQQHTYFSFNTINKCKKMATIQTASAVEQGNIVRY